MLWGVESLVFDNVCDDSDSWFVATVAFLKFTGGTDIVPVEMMLWGHFNPDKLWHNLEYYPTKISNTTWEKLHQFKICSHTDITDSDHNENASIMNLSGDIV